VADSAALLATLRATHPVSRCTIDGIDWEAIVCGAGARTLLLLPGALGLAETSFHHIAAFEQTARVISLSYPDAIDNIHDLVDGIVGLLAAYQVDKAYVVGGSYSGLIAQYLALWHPGCVAALLLSNSGAPNRQRGRRYALFARLLSAVPEPALHMAMRGMIRLFLPAATPEHRFWRAYFEEIIPRFRRRGLLNRLRIQADVDRAENAAQWAGEAKIHKEAAREQNADGDRQEGLWKGPTLIVDASHDHLQAPTQRDQLHRRFPQARVVTLAERGHAAALDEQATYLRIYQEFLCSLQQGAAGSTG